MSLEKLKSSIWMSADYHLSHTNIIKYCKRPFDSVHEMNKTITETHNNLVKPEDTFYFLGDLTMDKRKVTTFLEKLNGKIHFILGNHDYKHKKEIKKAKNVEWVGDLKIIHWEKTLICLCHYAMRVWPHSNRGSFQAYAHSHSTLIPVGQQLDVGIDNAYKIFKEYRPFTIDEVLEIASKQQTSS